MASFKPAPAHALVNGEPIEDDRSFLELVVDTAFIPLNVLTSAAAKRAYISSILLFIAANILYLFAILAYIIFYQAYIPHLSLTLPLHFQFDYNSLSTDPADFLLSRGTSSDPWATARIPAGTLRSNQAYDVTVHISMPRTPDNLGAGNFMLDLEILGQPSDVPGNFIETPSGSSSPFTPPVEGAPFDSTSRNTLARSRRPAILPWTSPGVRTARRLAALPLHVMGAVDERETLAVSMLERVEFKRGWRNVPQALKVSVASRKLLQMYAARVEFVARFDGLRWLMWRYRISSFVVLTGLFWMVEVGVAGVVWLGLAYCVRGRSKESHEDSSEAEEDKVRIERDGEMSDTERVFPGVSSRAGAIKYESPVEEGAGVVDARVKIEDEDDEGELVAPVSRAHEADDEDEDEKDDFVADMPSARDDSGIGTSLESSAGSARDAVRRRRFGGAS